MRRNIKHLSVLWGKTKPIYEILMAVQPGQSQKWGQEISILHKKHVHTAWCWHSMSATDRQELVRDGFSADAVAAIDKAIDEGLGLVQQTKKVFIFYGSQTGTAESYAKMLGTYAISHNITPIVCSLNEGVNVLKEGKHKPEAIVIVTSTYGTGEFPTNSLEFWKSLNKGELTSQLTSIPYTIFGLGNSHNDHFNAAAKKIDAKLREIGAKSFLRMQLSCELQPNGHDATFRGWKRSIWPALGAERETGAVGATYRINNVYGATDEIAEGKDHCVRPGFFRATVHQNELLTPKDYHPHHRKLTLRCKTDDQRENFGCRVRGRVADVTDHIEILPRNPEDLVERAIKALKITEPNQIVEVLPLPGAPSSFWDGRKMSVRTILREIIDLSAIPSRSLLELLATIATDATEASKLQDLADNLSANSEYEQLTRGIFSIVDMLEMFPKLNVSLAQLLSHAPHIVARTYSVANDNAAGHHEVFEIAYTTPTRWSGDKKHVGLCSGFMDHLVAGDHPWVRFVPSGVPLPALEKPVFLLALGTGIGSIRAVLLNRQLAKKAGKNVGPALVYYGFRHAKKDQLFVEDLAALEREGLCRTVFVASHDGKEFVSPMDKMDASVKDFIGADGEVLYCGLGGSVPLLVEAAMRRIGLDVASLRAAGRYHEEFFTPDLDMENLLKDLNKTSKGNTLAERMGKCEMFCMQCEQTYRGVGCHKVGVCGKTPRVAALQDLTVHAAKVLGHYTHHLRLLGAPENHAVNHLTLYALFTTLTNVNFDEARFVKLMGDLIEATKTQKAAYEALARSKGASIVDISVMPLPTSMPPLDGLVDLGRQVGVLTRFVDPNTQSAAGVSEMLVYGLKGIAAYADHSLMNNKEDPAIYAFIHKALAWLASPKAYDLGEGLGLCLEAGKANVATMSLLYNSNKTLGVPSPTVVPVKPVKGKAILVSGHDLIILKGLLEATEPLGINVYTHGEMLPAHSYPELRKHKNLVANFGGAWMRQSIEFPHFPGPILMTTNCLTEPHESYRDRIFTAGAVGWSNVPHIGDNMKDIKFDSLIKAAQAAPGYNNETAFSYSDPIGVRRPDTLTVGFGHETILSVAPTIIDQIQKGNITRFFVVGGCDGFEGARSYYTDLVAKMPKTAVILTVGCGKYRINHLDLGTIGDTGIPRILDMGQCNDSFSAVQVALALADVLKCKVSDLPLSIVLSWFEQKAVAVLLSCLQLGLKPIHIGPSLPAFVTPEVLDVLVKDFGIMPLGDPEEDLKRMLAAKGAA